MYSNKMIPHITRQNFRLLNTQYYFNNTVPMCYSKMRPLASRKYFQNSRLLNRRCYSTNIVPEDSSKLRPRVVKHDRRGDDIRMFENGESKTLLKIEDARAFISHNLGISWKQIDDVSGEKLMINHCGSDLIVISDWNTGRSYLIDGQGNLTKKFVLKPWCSAVSLHPNDSNAILLETWQSNDAPGDDYLETVTHYYTKDGGASGFILHDQCEYDDYSLEFASSGIDYKFITGGARDLVYKYDDDYKGYVAYALNFFSDSPLKFISFPFVVHQTQDFFFAIKDGRQLFNKLRSC